MRPLRSVRIKVGQAWRNVGHKEAHRTFSLFVSAPIFTGEQKEDAKAASLVVQLLDRLIVKRPRGIVISTVARVNVLW
jgi:hypothetical protein